MLPEGGGSCDGGGADARGGAAEEEAAAEDAVEEGGEEQKEGSPLLQQQAWRQRSDSPQWQEPHPGSAAVAAAAKPEAPPASDNHNPYTPGPLQGALLEQPQQTEHARQAQRGGSAVAFATLALQGQSPAPARQAFSRSGSAAFVTACSQQSEEEEEDEGDEGDAEVASPNTQPLR